MTEKESESASLGEISAANFFEILNDKKITNRRYAKDNNIDPSLLSKWKSGASSMTLEQIRQAADYLKVTTNDLLYNRKEKKDLSVLKHGYKYDPIMAQQNVEIRNIDNELNHPIEGVSTTLAFIIILTIVSAFIVSFSVYWVFILLLALIIFVYSIDHDLGYSKTFVINYLDDIYYKIDNPKNQYFKAELLSAAGLFLLNLGALIFLSFSNRPSGTPVDILGITYFFITVITLFFIFFAFFYRRKMKEVMYVLDLSCYVASTCIFILSMILIGVYICLMTFSISTYWPLILFSVGLISLSYLQLACVCKKSSEYRLYYEEHGKAPRILFPEQN